MDGNSNERDVVLVATNAGYFHDADGDTLTCSYVSSPKKDEDAPADISMSGNTLKIEPDDRSGDMTVTVTCKDGTGEKATDTLSIGVEGKNFSRR